MLPYECTLRFVLSPFSRSRVVTPLSDSHSRRAHLLRSLRSLLSSPQGGFNFRQLGGVGRANFSSQAGIEVVSASPLALKGTDNVPRALTVEEIAREAWSLSALNFSD